MTKIDKGEAFKMLDEGATQAEVGARFGASRQAVSKMIKDREKRAADTGAVANQAADFRKINTEQADHMVRAGMPLPEIAAHFGVHEANLVAKLKSAGVLGVDA